MRSVGLHGNTRTNFVGAHWSPVDTLPNGEDTRALFPAGDKYTRRIYCFAGRYVIWPLSSEPRGRVALATLCRQSAGEKSTQMTPCCLDDYPLLIVEPQKKKKKKTAGRGTPKVRV